MESRQVNMNWEKEDIVLEDGKVVRAQTPVIISASRATDIPAFYTDWLVDRIKKGYVEWVNPFNGVPLYVSFAKTRLIIFWSKNPTPLFKHLDFFDATIPNYYLQYTLNDYEKEGLEPNVPSLESRIDTFIRFSEKIGKEKIIWRFDPLLLTDQLDVNELPSRVEKIGNRLKGYTEKLVFSFADIRDYRKVKSNLGKKNINYREFDLESMKEFARSLQQLNKKWGFELATCAEELSLEEYTILPNKCVDDDLIIRLFSHDFRLMDFLKVKITYGDVFNNVLHVEKLKNNKDKGQRKYCGCIVSKDIGRYNTCPHLCTYCYANTTEQIAMKNWNEYNLNQK